MGQFGSKGGLRRIVPVKSDRNQPNAALTRLLARPKALPKETPARKSV